MVMSKRFWWHGCHYGLNDLCKKDAAVPLKGGEDVWAAKPLAEVKYVERIKLYTILIDFRNRGVI